MLELGQISQAFDYIANSVVVFRASTIHQEQFSVLDVHRELADRTVTIPVHVGPNSQDIHT